MSLMKKKYKTYKDMIADIYKKARNPKDPEHKQAVKILNKLWLKYAKDELGLEDIEKQPWRVS